MTKRFLTLLTLALILGGCAGNSGPSSQKAGGGEPPTATIIEPGEEERNCKRNFQRLHELVLQKMGSEFGPSIDLQQDMIWQSAVLFEIAIEDGAIARTDNIGSKMLSIYPNIFNEQGKLRGVANTSHCKK